MMRFEMYRDAGGEWRWRFRAANDKILADSGEGYDNEADCIDAIALLRRNVEKAPLEFISATAGESGEL